ncbi:MAG: CopG family transcriptional regulator [Alphaproteobacteria bacterium]|nr:CopG family transcriptional regulator [Alphaproteobacteria bacterium]
MDRPENPPEFARAVREGIGDADAGRTLSYEKIRRWLLSWGQEKEMPPPE